MPTLSDIQDQVQRLDGASKLLGRKEIKELPSILWEDEQIEHVIQGTYNNGNGLLVGTDRRIIFVDKGLLYGLKVEDFPYGKISSIQYGTGALLGEVTIFASGNKAEIKNVQKVQARNFGEWARNRISDAQPSADASGGSGVTDLTGELQKLAELHESGALSDEEFQAAKTKLLA